MSPASDKPAERAAEFVDQIVDDPNNVPDVMRLYGYLGASSEEAHERLYLNPDLQYYVDAPASAVLNRMAVPKDQDPYGATVLWVRRDAALKYKMGPAAQALANYFAGAIAGAAAAGTLSAPVAAGGPFAPHSLQCTPNCLTHGCCGHTNVTPWAAAAMDFLRPPPTHQPACLPPTHGLTVCCYHAEFLDVKSRLAVACGSVQCSYFCHCGHASAGVFDHAAAAPRAAAFGFLPTMNLDCGGTVGLCGVYTHVSCGVACVTMALCMGGGGPNEAEFQQMAQPAAAAQAAVFGVRTNNWGCATAWCTYLGCGSVVCGSHVVCSPT
jgi:hypothetical protein